MFGMKRREFITLLGGAVAAWPRPREGRFRRYLSIPPDAAVWLPTTGLPDNFMERLTPQRVASHIERRRQAVKRWAQANPSFVMQFEEARRKWLATARARKPN